MDEQIVILKQADQSAMNKSKLTHQSGIYPVKQNSKAGLPPLLMNNSIMSKSRELRKKKQRDKSKRKKVQPPNDFQEYLQHKIYDPT